MTVKQQQVIDSFDKLSPKEQRSVAKVINSKLKSKEQLQLSEGQLEEVLSRRDEMIKNPSIGISEAEFRRLIRKR